MNRGRAATGGYSSHGGRSSRSSGHHSYSNRHSHMTGEDGNFSDGSFNSRGGRSHGRRGHVNWTSPSRFHRYSNGRPTPVYKYEVKKPLGDESLDTGLQQNRNALNPSESVSEQPECLVASGSSREGDSSVLSACSGVVEGKTLNLDFSMKVNIAQLQNENQTPLHSEEQCSKMAPFDICQSSITRTPVLNPPLLAINRQKRNDAKHALEGQLGEVLGPGMILLKNYLSMDDQVKIVKLCQGLGLGPGGFYRPGYEDGAKLQLKMMCLGKNWDPNTNQYGEVRPDDGAKPPDIPRGFHLLVERAMKNAYALLGRDRKGRVEDILPCVSPDICIVNFYSTTGRLGLHQDKDESEGSLKKGLPVVSFSIGDTGEFRYGNTRDEKNAKTILLESGDVLIFGGKSRHIFHGVRSILAETAPDSLRELTNLRPGRLNLTFRQY